MRANVNKCIGCGACEAACPKGCIAMQQNEKGFFVANINEATCINCGLCDKICPLQDKNNSVWEPKIFFAVNKDTEIRVNSSSGGVFSEVAMRVLQNGGVCFGVDFECASHEAKYVEISTIDSLGKLRKSKYVQANPNAVLPIVKKRLEDNIPVLFSGTPCMVHALKKYLKKEYSNLITCDFICHGVPSAGVLKDYLKVLEKKYKGRVASVDFRPKTYGWSNHSLKVTFDNGKTSDKLMMFDPYFKAFMADNVILNDACYHCNYIQTKYSDITLADFWGYRRINAELNDGKGLSLVFANTEKGQQYLVEADNLALQEIPKESVRYIFDKKEYGEAGSRKQEAFFKDYTEKKVLQCIEKHTAHPAWKEKLKYFIKKALRRG